MTLSPGTKVRLLTGPIGTVHYLTPTRFTDVTLDAGYETDVADVPHTEPGWVYLNTDADEIIAPISEDFVEVVA